MMARHVSLRIDNVYLDSFLYSGALFLIGMDGTIASYDWQSIVSQALSLHGREDLEGLFLDSRHPKVLEGGDDGLVLEVPIEILRDSETSSIKWDVWPTDFSIYANKIYISDESGAYTVGFDYKSKSISQDSVKTVSRGYIYSIAPGDGGRLAMASVRNGLTLVVMNGQEWSLVEDDIFDCDWFGTSLVSNSRAHSYLTKFTSLPKKEDFADDQAFLASLKLVKDAAPITTRLDIMRQNEFRWLVGEEVIDDVALAAKAHPDNSRIVKARSASFGSIIEYLDKLMVLRSDCRQILDIQKPIFWRTFSRSKNYLNHLHCCSDEGMQIRAYSTASQDSDRFSVEMADLGH